MREKKRYLKEPLSSHFEQGEEGKEEERKQTEGERGEERKEKKCELLSG